MAEDIPVTNVTLDENQVELTTMNSQLNWSYYLQATVDTIDATNLGLLFAKHNL